MIFPALPNSLLLNFQVFFLSSFSQISFLALFYLFIWSNFWFLSNNLNFQHLQVVSSFNGSRNSSIMTRSTQICKNESSVVACYNMDDKKLELWGQDASLMSNIPVSDVVTDLCPLYLDNSGEKTLLAALSENKCRILNVIPSAVNFYWTSWLSFDKLIFLNFFRIFCHMWRID